MERMRDREPGAPVALRPLKRRSEYLAVQRTGLRVPRPSLVLQAARRLSADRDDRTGRADEDGGIGIGFTVTRRTGKAVVRNRIRRRLKAAAREVLPRMGRPGIDYVLIGRRGALHRPFAGILRDLRSATKAVHRLLDREERSTGSPRTGCPSHPGKTEPRRKGRSDGA